jgi:phospholipid/cholesterol/gamma-HCH transport system substrate-binding protein
MEAGEVLAIRVPPSSAGSIRVTFRVLESLRPILTTDSVATIQTDGIVGNKVLQVDVGTEQAPRANDGDTIQSREPFDFADLMQEVSDTVKQVSDSVDDVKADVENAIEVVARTTQNADDLITGVTDDIQGVASASNKIANDVQLIVHRVEAGEGTVGKLFNDDQLYQNLRGSVDEVQGTVRNLRQTTDDVQRVVSDFREKGVVDDVKQTTENVRDVTERAKKAIEAFQPAEGEGQGLTADLRQTIAYANETMEGLSENAEALKRNWFFRGFFKKRRFFDLDSISVAEYKAGESAPGWPVQREWIHASRLFTIEADGSEQLSDSGKAAIRRAMAGFVQYTKTQPIIVEGYGGGETRSDEFLRSHERADLVRRYLIEEFYLKSTYIGIMQMGSVAAKGDGTENWDGVALVLFSNKPPDARGGGTGAARD